MREQLTGKAPYILLVFQRTSSLSQGFVQALEGIPSFPRADSACIAILKGEMMMMIGKSGVTE